jgi:hypothetical protein
MSLDQLVGQLYYIYRRPESEPQSSRLSALRMKFRATELLDKKNSCTPTNMNMVKTYHLFWEDKKFSYH